MDGVMGNVLKLVTDMLIMIHMTIVLHKIILS